MSEKTSPPISVFYIGKDQSYFKSLEGTFRRYYASFEFNFVHYPKYKEKNAREVFVELAKTKPDILFIDLSADKEKSFELIKLLRKENTTKLISTTALFDYLSPKEDISRAIMYGVRLNQIKSVEISDVVYAAFYFYDSQNVSDRELAVASFKQEANLTIDLRLAYANESHFRVETNIPFNEGQVIHLSEHCLDKIIPSKRFLVSNLKETDLYYNTRYAMDLEFQIMDDYNSEEIAKMLKEGNDQEKLDAEEMEKTFKNIKERLNEWVLNNYNKVSPKQTKVFVIDRELSLFEEIKRPLNDYEFSINIQRRILQGVLQIKRTLPHLIVYVFDTPQAIEKAQMEQEEELQGEMPSEDPFEFNNENSLNHLIVNINSIDNYEPIIILFRSQYKSEDLQKKYSYQKIITYSEVPSLNIIKNFADTHTQVVRKNFETQIKKKFDQIKASTPAKLMGKTYKDLIPKQVYFKSSDPKTLIVKSIQVEFLEMREADLYFKSNLKIPTFTILQSEYPTSMLLVSVEKPPTSPFANDSTVTRALITAVGENERKALRQFLNSILGMEKEEQQTLEKKEFEELNKKTLQDIQEKKQQELQEQKEKELLEKQEEESQQEEKENKEKQESSKDET